MSEEKVNSDQLSVSSKNAEDYFFRASAEDFKKIPGSPVGYWASDKQREAFVSGILLQDIAPPKQGIATASNDTFLRRWSEVCLDRITFGLKNKDDAVDLGAKWLPYNKGGDFRKWYGNNEFIINWENDGEAIRGFCDDNGKPRSAIRNPDYYFRPSVTWTDISSSSFGVRQSQGGFLFDGASHSAFPNVDDLDFVTGLLCVNTTYDFLKIINPTMHFQVGNVASIPVPFDNLKTKKKAIESGVSRLVEVVKLDWDSYETSWDFASLPLITHSHAPAWECSPNSDDSSVGVPTRERGNQRNCPLNTDNSVSAAYATLRQHWQSTTLETQHLEQENNRIFIDAYGLQDELTPEVPLKEITLTCNPHFRYGGNKSDEELEALLLADTMKEFISYAVGCMFGRYSLDKEGLILANQGETLADYFRITGTAPASRSHAPAWECRLNSDDSSVGVPTRERGNEVLCTFEPDDDNVIPLIDFDGDWFEDDISERFKVFLKVSFGEAHFAENVAFIDAAIGKTIKKFFLKDFYSDHVKRYKKRPIYWLFSSPKGAFNALIYMHRYRPDTVSVVLNDYLREFRTKLEAKKSSHEQLEVSATASAKEKTQAIKAVQKINKVLDEINDYEHELLYPLAGQNIAIDLDDGVKHNYPLFGKALKKIPGLS